MFLHITKWIFLVAGIGIMLGSLVLVLYTERLLCFSKINKISISRPRRVEVENTQAVNVSLDKDGLNPNLYPQVENRNVVNNLRLFQVTELGGPVRFRF